MCILQTTLHYILIIRLYFSGNKVVTQRISVESIQNVAKKIQRPPVIWDNLHANDYDQTRLYLGPYEGRPPELVQHLNGVLTNPNCEYGANYVAMHTLSQWSKNKVENYPGNNSEYLPPLFRIPSCILKNIKYSCSFSCIPCPLLMISLSQY